MADPAQAKAASGPAAEKRAQPSAPTGSPGRYLGLEHFGGQAYYHYRAERGTWVSATLEERGYAAVYAKETGFGAYKGVVRSPTGELLSNPDRIKPGQEYFVPVLPAQVAQRPELGSARGTSSEARSVDPADPRRAQTQDVGAGTGLSPAARGVARSQPQASAGTSGLNEALRAADQLTAFDLLPKPVRDAIDKGQATWPDGTPVRPDDFRQPTGGPLDQPKPGRPRAGQRPSRDTGTGTAPDSRVSNLADILLGADKLTAFDLVPPPVQEAILRGEATWPDGTPVLPDDLSRLKEQRRRGQKPLYRDLLRPGEREPSVEELAQLGGLLRAFLMLLATDPTVADRIVRDTLFFRYPDDQAARAHGLELFWQTIFDPLLWLSLNPSALLGVAPEGLQLARQLAPLARNAGAWSIQANKLLGEASALARSGRVAEAMDLARQAQSIAVSEVDRLTAARGLGDTAVLAAPVPVIPSAGGNATTIQEARNIADSLRLNPPYNAVETPAFTVNGEPYWGPFYRADRGIWETLEQGRLGGRGPSVGAALPDNPSAMAYMRNHPVIEQEIADGFNSGRNLSFYTRVRPERFYGNGAHWPARENTFGLPGRVAELRPGMQEGVINGYDYAFVEVFFVQLH
jgi:hypothetical protein